MIAGQQVILPKAQPAGWEWVGAIFALLPFMVLVMVFSLLSKTVEEVTKPEVVREIRPIAEEVALARVGARALPRGG